MTCIVGVKYGDRVFIGGDSAGASNSVCVARKDPKVFKVEDFVIGFTSSFRMGELIQHSFIPPEKPSDPTELYKYMCTDFIDGIRKVLKDGGWSNIDNNTETGGVFLVGIRDRLFCIEDDFQVGESIAGYDTVGSGMYYALGSLYTSQYLNPSILPRKMITIALETATEFNPFVRPPYTILST